MNFKFRFAFLLLPILICAGLNGCSNELEKTATKVPVTRKITKKPATTSAATSPVQIEEEKEDTLSDTTSDVRIELEISNLWLRSDANLYNALSVSCQNGEVVLTGSVADAALRIKAEQLARQVEGVQKITNRIAVSSNKTSEISQRLTEAG